MNGSSDEDRSGHDSGDARGPLAFLSALTETISVPVIQYDLNGRITMSNRQAEPLLAESADSPDRRLLTFDGLDVWELVVSKLDDARPFLAITTKVRLARGGVTEVSFIAVPIMSAGGALGGATLYAYDHPDDRALAQEHLHPLDPASADDDASFARLLATLVDVIGADAGVLAEVEPDRPSRGRTIAAVLDGEVLEGFEWQLVGTPAASSPGRRTVWYAGDIAQSNPEDSWAEEQGFKVFVGCLLYDAAGGRVGTLGVYARHDMGDASFARGVTRLFASRISPLLLHIRAERALRESEERYSALFEHSHMPMLLLDPVSSQIVDANEAACDFYGYSHDDMTTMSVLQLDVGAPEDARDEINRAVVRLRDYFQFKHRLANGLVRDVEMHAGPITVQGRDLVYGIVHDVTERRRTEFELQRYKQELEILVQRRTADLMRSHAELQRTSRASEAFYENMGTELRTPLQTVIGFSDALSQGMAGDLNEEQRRQIAMIGDAGRQLLELTGDILELSRLDIGVERCNSEQFDVCGLIESVVVGGRQLAEERGIELDVRPQRTAINVFTDRNKVEQVLLQLLSNALKYTVEGSVCIEADVVANDRVMVRVKDTGVGIDADELPHVFEEFRQVTRRRAGTHEGTGLGLAVSRRIAEVLGGTIEVESVPGEGSTFTFIFPARCEEGS
ncbi:MAG: PAS domain-containing sensor histidine kinase [Coriobacteriia bacterium]